MASHRNSVTSQQQQQASSSWRNPPISIQKKFNIKPLGDDFEPTKEEQSLLDMYETVKMYEKEAARLKEEAARAKLDAAAAKYQQSQNKVAADVAASPKRPVAKKKKKKRKTPRPEDQDMGGMMDEDEGDSSEYEDDDDDEGLDTLSERREAKLMEMREQLQEAKSKADPKAAEEALRAQLLQEQDDDDLDQMTLLKRRRLSQTDLPNKESLIASLENQQTPPHEFSQKIGLKAWEGKVLYPPTDAPIASKWKPSADSGGPTDGDMSFVLRDFDIAQASNRGNNTIAIKYTAPMESKRFSINIAMQDHNNYDSVLFHFNPRQFEKGGQLVLNSKGEGLWGQAINVPLSRLPKIFGEQASFLMIQITDEGFDVFIEDKHCARLEHRSPLPGKKTDLVLQFPATDDYSNPENWSVYRVWWGHKELKASGDLADVYGVNAFSGMHPKKLFIRGLSKISSQQEVDLRRAELERAFRKYGGDLGVVVTAPTNVTFAFVECASEVQANLALEEMKDQYDIKRARRTRHEALQEERAAREAAAGKSGRAADWD